MKDNSDSENQYLPADVKGKVSKYDSSLSIPSPKKSNSGDEDSLYLTVDKMKIRKQLTKAEKIESVKHKLFNLEKNKI